MRPVLENARRGGSVDPNRANKPREVGPSEARRTERRAPSELLLILVFFALGLVSLFGGVFVNEWMGTLLLFGGAIVVGWWYDRG